MISVQEVKDAVLSGLKDEITTINKSVFIEGLMFESVEFREVEKYIRRLCSSDAEIGRSENATTALIWLKPEAIMFLIKKYIISIIDNFNSEDYLNQVVVSILISDDVGVAMEAISNTKQKRAICLFLKWIFENDSSFDLLDEEIPAKAEKIWCKS